ncbi:MAG: permease [Carboxylicivirga sp.]|jgi:uncharacterized membrane protein YraQ (UPF0718 family)|nr:permease [Carboxylicivirga sp.]
MTKSNAVSFLLTVVFIIYIGFSFHFSFTPGESIGKIAIQFTKDLLLILPCAFILIGLFEVWIKQETIEKYFGLNSGFKGHIWSILLAGTTVGGMYVAFPIAATLLKKGAKPSIIYSYLGFSAICRIPMTIFEASFIGLKFTLIRLFISIPLVIFSSVILEKLVFHNKH